MLAIGARSAAALRQHTASLPPNRCAAHREPFSYVEVEVGISDSVSVSDIASVSGGVSASARGLPFWGLFMLRAARTLVDLAMFNLDLNYSISLNSATTTSYRTGYHQVQLNLAYVF